MNRIWANRLWAGIYSFDEVPNSRKDSVKNIMQNDVASEKPGCTKELYEYIIGEPYPGE